MLCVLICGGGFLHVRGYAYAVKTLLSVVGTVAFVGSHLDVVPANPETWERNPFKLVVEVSDNAIYSE